MKITHLAHLVQPCSHCGIPCLGTALAWRDHGGERLIVEIDRPTLSDLFLSLWAGQETMEGYSELPSVLRDWNEGKGWMGMDAQDGVPYDPRELRALVLILRPLHIENARHVEVLSALDALCESALTVDAPVFLRED